jgi:phosphoglycolate phosphatase
MIIFDLDGTLVDSRGDIAAAANAALKDFGLGPVNEAQVGRSIGRGTARLFRDLLGRSTEDAVITKLVTSFRRRYEAGLCERTKLYDGVPILLEALGTRPAVIVTNKSQPFADSIVDRLGVRRYFKAIYGAEAFKGTKPSPRPLVEACTRWRVKPGDAVMVGDTIVDMQAGKSAGLTTVAALYGYGDADELRGMAPDFEAKTVLQLEKILTEGGRA